MHGTKKTKTHEKYTVAVRSVLPIPIATAWQWLQKPSTFYFVAAPFLVAKPLTSAQFALAWQVGDSVTFRLWLLGFVPFGKHTIRIVGGNADTHTIVTHEHSAHYRSWQHTLTLAHISPSETAYTDTIVFSPRFGAWLQPYLVRLFFEHRHRRWQKFITISHTQNKTV